MNLNAILFPRRLEADGSTEKIREALAVRSVKLWPGGTVDVPLLNLSDALIESLRKARLQRRIRLGFDDILEKLAAEKKGLDELKHRDDGTPSERLSRLLLFSNDGAQRLYRNIELALYAHEPRMFGCMLDIDSTGLGKAITGRTSLIKVILIEHKDAMSDFFRALM